MAISGLVTPLTAKDNPTKLPIVPLPAEIETTSEKPFAANRPIEVTVDTSVDGNSLHLANILADKLTGKASAKDKKSKKGQLILTANHLLPAEGYRLTVNPDTIILSASTPAGFFYGVQTLRQLNATSADGSIPSLLITDEPRMEWRGFMLDEGRHFFGKEEVKRILDLMSLYKFNRFHWHLTEDQGWRIEIKKWPKLTEVGAWRPSAEIGRKGVVPKPDAKPYGGYYTHDDIREIVAYAKERFIEVIPEIDLPGHTQAMVAAYPELLACDPENKHEVWPLAGVSDDVMNVTRPEAIQMSKDIIDDLIELFPYKYIHLGGDECPTDKWRKNEDCQKRLAEIGSDNYRDLQLDYYRSLQQHVDAKPESERRRLIFWNEVIHGNTSMLSDSITIMSWIGTKPAEEDGRRAASMGYEVIMTPQIPYYINRRQSTDSREPETQGQGTETLKRVYTYMPLHDVTDDIRPRYKGIQGNFWSEHVPDASTLEYLMLPRLTAIAEAAWTKETFRDYDDYIKRLRPHKRIYEKFGLNYAPYIFEEESK